MKKMFYIISSVFVVIAAVISILFFQYNKDDRTADKGNKSINKDVKIALVNEDQPVKYNGKDIKLGQSFINRLSKEDTHSFETVNRDVAENGMKNGAYQVMVIIPKNFSKLGMQLDKKTPAKMAIQYKTAAGQNEKLTREVEQVVSTVLNSFNKNLINIYFSSVIDNLHNAQKNVSDMKERQKNTDHMFQNYLLNPLNDYPKNFTELMVNSINANKSITQWIVGYNNSLLKQDNSIFNINRSASEIVQNQSSEYDEDISSLEKALNAYQTQNESADIESQIKSLEKMNQEYESQAEANEKEKSEYKTAFEQNLESMKEEVDKEKSPFTDKMIEDYRKELTTSLNEQLDKNPELNSVKEEIEQNNQSLRSVFLTNMVKSIEREESSDDATYITDLSRADLEATGLSHTQVEKYAKILSNLNAFKSAYNEDHPDQTIQQAPYKGELTANNTEKLTTDGVKFKRNQTVKSKDVNRLTIVTDSNFDFDGTIDINGKKYDVKDDEIQLETDVKNYKVAIEGIARLKQDTKNQEAFLKDKTMHLQLVFGQAVKGEESAEVKPETMPAVPNAQEEAKTPTSANANKSANVVDISMSHDLSGDVISPQLNQQLRSLDQFQSQYELYNETKVSQIKPQIDNNAIVDMMVNEVITDMTDFKDNKKALMTEIEKMQQSSDEMVEKMMNEKDWIANNQQEVQSLIQNLSAENDKLKEKPEVPKIDREEGKEFTTLSMQLDDDIQKMSERSSQLLSDSQSTKSTAESVSTDINRLDGNVNNLHASGRSLGTRANELNKQMIANSKENDLFVKNFETVLKNSKDGDKQNEALKDFMSNPIKKKNLENVLANNGDKNTISPSIMVLIMYLISIMTAYLIHSYFNARGPLKLIKNDFSENNELWNKAINSGSIGLVGLIEGLIIGLVALNQYNVLPGYRIKFILMVMLTMIVFVLINTYLLRQVKAIGMMLILTVLGIYLIAMNQWTSSTKGEALSAVSPLSYIDTMFFNYLNAEHPVGAMLFFLVIFALIGLGLNALVKKLGKASPSQ